MDEVTPHGMAVATGSLENRFDDLLSRTFRIPQNVRFANHLRHEQPYLFTFRTARGWMPPTMWENEPCARRWWPGKFGAAIELGTAPERKRS
jgi:hypothetical protein